MTLTNQFRTDYLEKQVKRYGATKLSDGNYLDFYFRNFVRRGRFHN